MVEELQIQTASEQVAEHLKREMVRGTWMDTMPGRAQLVKRLGVGSDTVQVALELLEKEGFLLSQGQGRPRRIRLPDQGKPPALQVRFLLYEKQDRFSSLYNRVRYRAEQLGHKVDFADKDLHDLGMDPKRVARYVEKHRVGAWVVSGGTRGILEYMAEQALPVFALYGNQIGLPIAGTATMAPLSITINRLLELGHKRIVMLVREERRKPTLSKMEQNYLKLLKVNGISVGSYNLPDWGDTKIELIRELDSLFRLTPPTALLLSEPNLYICAERYLASRGILAPRDVSLFCNEPEPIFDWCEPPVSHFSWDQEKVLRRLVRWIDNTARGKEDLRQVHIESKFVEGGTIGPARRWH